MSRLSCVALCLASAFSAFAASPGPSSGSIHFAVLPEAAPHAWLAGPGVDGTGSPGLKKPGLGVLFSAVLPGAGQAYAGSWVRAAVYAAVEAGLWVGYARLTEQGDARRAEFRNYADTHWSEATWRRLYNPETDEPPTHDLPDTKTQQYYEMIGKYDEFKKGWNDWVVTGPDLTPNRDRYETMRDRHNQKLINASYCAMAALGNRLVSCFDAGFTIRNRNMVLRARLETGTRFVEARAVPMLGLRMAW